MSTTDGQPATVAAIISHRLAWGLNWSKSWMAWSEWSASPIVSVMIHIRQVKRPHHLFSSRSTVGKRHSKPIVRLSTSAVESIAVIW